MRRGQQETSLRELIPPTTYEQPQVVHRLLDIRLRQMCLDPALADQPRLTVGLLQQRTQTTRGRDLTHQQPNLKPLITGDPRLATHHCRQPTAPPLLHPATY